MVRSTIVLGCAAACFASMLAACFATIDDSKIDHGAGDASVDALGDASGDGAGDGASDAGLDVLETGCPSGMLAVPVPDDSGTKYCIDEAEVTLDEYGAFIDASEPPAVGSQSVECAFNTTYRPTDWGPGSVGDRAASGLDWCDAYAYCKWAGKRLCGRIGGGPVDFNGGATNAPEGQWFNACSRGGTRTYPYGSTYQAQTCVGGDYTPTPTGPRPVRTPSCVGGFDGLFDMSGNVGEFIDSCSTEKGCDGGHECELCILIGGGFQDRGSRLDCAYINQLDRGGQYVDNGARCCWP